MNAPFVAGRACKVTETKATEYFSAGVPRRWFNVRFDRPVTRSTVFAGGSLPAGQMMCSEHGINSECDCITAVQSFIATDSK